MELDNYEEILNKLKSYNENNNIIFIANDGIVSDKLEIYNVSKDENDTVARNFLENIFMLSNMMAG